MGTTRANIPHLYDKCRECESRKGYECTHEGVKPGNTICCWMRRLPEKDLVTPKKCPLEPHYKQLSNKIKEQLCKSIIDGKIKTDSDIEDFCDAHKQDIGSVFHWLAILKAPLQCRSCKHVDLRPNLPPCSTCNKAYLEDHYEKDTSGYKL